MKKTILFSFVAGAIVSASGTLAFQKNINGVFQNEPSVIASEPEQTNINSDRGNVMVVKDQETIDKVESLTKQLDKEKSCRKMNEALIEIKNSCGFPFRGIDECIKERTERAAEDETYREETLAAAKKVTQLKIEYESMKGQCGE